MEDEKRLAELVVAVEGLAKIEFAATEDLGAAMALLGTMPGARCEWSIAEVLLRNGLLDCLCLEESCRDIVVELSRAASSPSDAMEGKSSACCTLLRAWSKTTARD